MNQKKLSELRCKACEGEVDALTPAQLDEYRAQIKEWELAKDGLSIHRRFSFKNFFWTMSFVNAMAHVANLEGHHPDVSFGYNYCEVTFTTHAVKGLTINDLICAKKIDLLV